MRRVRRKNSAYCADSSASSPDFEEAGDEDVFRKIRKDFDAKGITHSDHIIRRKMEEQLTVAAEQVQSEIKK